MRVENKKHYLINGALFILAILSFFGWYQFKSNPKTSEPAAAVDAFAIGVEGVQFNILGQKRAEVQTPKLLHFTREDSSLLTRPYVVLYSENNKAPWIISSQTGKTYNGTRRIDLIEDVVIHQPAGSQNTDTVITTSLLHVFPKDQLANTDQSVTLVQSGIKITSKGMNAYLDQKRVTLLSQARGLYDPTKASSNNSRALF